MKNSNNRIDYKKEPLTYDEQLQKLKERGLKIQNEEEAKFYLEQISYYRLSAYWHPLLEDAENHKFKKDSSFDTAIEYYCFDKDLRKLVFSEIEKIEIGVKAKMIYILSSKHHRNWHIDINNFKDVVKFEELKKSMDKEFKRSQADYAVNFRKKYEGDPPSWIQFETLSFGTISKLYENLKKSKKLDISTYFELSENVFGIWLQNIVIIRNICAHHDRLWNRSFRHGIVYNTKTKKLPALKIDKNQIDKLYFRLVMIRHFLFTINPTSSFSLNIQSLLKKYKQIELKILGFPENWIEQEFWK